MWVDLIEGVIAHMLLCTASAQKKGAYAGVRQNVSDILDMIIVTSNSHQNCLNILVTQA